jgi:hypothetical protein
MITNTFLLPVWDTIESAWQKTYGAKSCLWAAMTVLFLIAVVFGIAEGISEVFLKGTGLTSLLNVLSYSINYLLSLGVLYIGIKRASGVPITYNIMFTPFYANRFLKIILLYLLQIILIMAIGAICIALPALIIYALTFVLVPASVIIALSTILLYSIASLVGFYLIIRWILAVAFILDQQSSPWQALAQSFAATRGNVWRIIAILFLQFCILLIGMVLIIGSIWTVPFSYILYGEIYRTLVLNVRLPEIK